MAPPLKVAGKMVVGVSIYVSLLLALGLSPLLAAVSRPDANMKHIDVIVSGPGV